MLLVPPQIASFPWPFVSHSIIALRCRSAMRQITVYKITRPVDANHSPAQLDPYQTILISIHQPTIGCVCYCCPGDLSVWPDMYECTCQIHEVRVADLQIWYSAIFKIPKSFELLTMPIIRDPYCNISFSFSGSSSQRFLDCNFFSLVAPSYTPRSTAAATVNVPPTIAHNPVRNPVKLLGLSSRLMTFIGEIS